VQIDGTACVTDNSQAGAILTDRAPAGRRRPCPAAVPHPADYIPLSTYATFDKSHSDLGKVDL